MIVLLNVMPQILGAFVQCVRQTATSTDSISALVQLQQRVSKLWT